MRFLFILGQRKSFLLNYKGTPLLTLTEMTVVFLFFILLLGQELVISQISLPKVSLKKISGMMIRLLMVVLYSDSVNDSIRRSFNYENKRILALFLHDFIFIYYIY